LHHFGVVGVTNGLSIMMDTETHTLWDHISGEAFEGHLKGTFLKTWSILFSTAAAEFSSRPDTQLFISNYRSPLLWLMGFALTFMGINKHGFLAPNFHFSMSRPINPRLPKLSQRLGVIVRKHAKYYPMDSIREDKVIKEDWKGRKMVIKRKKGIPRAVWEDNGEMSMQLLSRWYGFSFTYPECEIYGKKTAIMLCKPFIRRQFAIY
jgi:hypothetical protein